MRSKELFRQLLPLLLIASYFFQASNSFSQSGEDSLYRVKKIFIEAVPNVAEGIRTDPYLKAELKKRGFEIVRNASMADAILSLVNAQAEIVLDSDENIPQKSIYQYQLALPNKKIIWKAKIKFVSKPTMAEENEYVSKRMAEKITKKFGAK